MRHVESLRTFGALALSALVGLVVADLALRFSPSWHHFLASFPEGEVARVDADLRWTPEREVDVALIGSSLAVYDLDAERLSARLAPRRALNLGLNGAVAETEAMMLPYLIDLRPEAVVYVVGESDLRRRAARKTVRFWHPVAAAALIGPGDVLAHPDFTIIGALGFLNEVVRHRTSLRDRAGKPRGWHHALAGGPLQHDPQRVQASLEQVRRSNRVSGFDGTGPNVRALRWMAARLADHGIQLLVVQGPLHPWVEGSSFPDEPTARLAELTDELGVPALLGGRELRAADYPHEAFRDAVHLAEPGRMRLTDTVAQALVQLLEPPSGLR